MPKAQGVSLGLGQEVLANVNDHPWLVMKTGGVFRDVCAGGSMRTCHRSRAEAVSERMLSVWVGWNWQESACVRHAGLWVCACGNTGSGMSEASSVQLGLGASR